jgi:hypothetical protein
MLRGTLIGLAVTLVGVILTAGYFSLGRQSTPPAAEPAWVSQVYKHPPATVTIIPLDGILCRRLQLDNDTGLIIEGRIARCDGTASPDAAASADGTASPNQPAKGQYSSGSRTEKIKQGFSNR